MTPPTTIRIPAIRIPRWKADVDASTDAEWTRAASATARSEVEGTPSGCSFASETVSAAVAERGCGPRLESTIEPKLAEIFATRQEKVMFVKGDADLDYGEVAEVIDMGHQAEVDNIGLITPRIQNGQ